MFNQRIKRKIMIYLIIVVLILMFLAVAVKETGTEEIRKPIVKYIKKDVNLISRGGTERKTQAPQETISYSYESLQVDKNIVRIIEQQCSKHGLNKDVTKEFFEVIFCIVAYESEFNPNKTTITKYEHSIGLLQINTITNKPKDMNLQEFRIQLENPEFNLDYQLDELRQYYLKGKAKGLDGIDLIAYVARYGQRPDWSRKNREYILKTIKSAYSLLQNSKINQ